MIAMTILALATMQSAQAKEKAEVRERLTEVYKSWDGGRVAIDRKTLEKTLLPDFYVILPDGKHTRKEFVDMILNQPSNVKHLKFTSQILTVNQKDDDWITVVTEKTEVEVTPSQGAKFRGYGYWVTRDCWHKGADGSWQARWSEAIGNESWKGKPPSSDWWR